MLKIAIMRFGGQVWLPKCNGGQVRWFRGRGYRVDFPSIWSELKYHGNLSLKSLRLDHPLSSNLLLHFTTIKMMMMAIVRTRWRAHWLGALTRTSGETGRWLRIDNRDRDIALLQVHTRFSSIVLFRLLIQLFSLCSRLFLTILCLIFTISLHSWKKTKK